MKSILCFLFCCSLFAEPVVSVSSKAEQPVNLIRKMLREIPIVDDERALLDLDPVINLGIGQPHMAMNRQVLESLIEYLQGLRELTSEDLAREMGYSHSAGLYETRLWISKAFSQDFPEAGKFHPDEVMVTSGAAGALTIALNVLVERGDKVAVFAPYFAAYKNQVENTEARLHPIYIDKERSFAALLEKALRENPEIKVFLWNDPNNPLGSKATEEELRGVGEVLKMYPNLIVIHDEVYRDFRHHAKPLSLLNVAPQLRDRSIIIRSLAKDTLGAPGIRAGMLFAPTSVLTPKGKRINLIELMANEQLRDIVSVSVLVQKTLVFALQSKIEGGTYAWTEKVLKEYEQNAEFFVSAIQEMNLSTLLKPEGAFYLMVDVSSLIGKKVPDTIGQMTDLRARIGKNILEDDKDVAAFFLYSAGVAAVPGSGFDTPLPSVRISCAKDRKELMEAADRLRFVIDHLKNE